MTADLVHTEIIYFLSWDIIIFLLLIPVLRLPLVYIGVVVFVIIALTMVVLGLEYPGSVATFDHLAGIALFTVAGLGARGVRQRRKHRDGRTGAASFGPPALK